MNQKQMMKALQAKFKGLDVRDASEFYGYKSTGLWMPNASYDFGVKGTMDGTSEVDKFLEANGWYVEPYDAETMMAIQG